MRGKAAPGRRTPPPFRQTKSPRPKGTGFSFEKGMAFAGKMFAGRADGRSLRIQKPNGRYGLSLREQDALHDAQLPVQPPGPPSEQQEQPLLRIL